MKAILLPVSLLALAVSFTAAQKKEPVKDESVAPSKSKISRVQVTPTKIPPGKAYVVDLTREGRVYEGSADIDYSRVRVRTETPLSDVVRRLQLTGRFLVGSGNDLSLVDFGFPPDSTPEPPEDGVSEAKCNGLVCGCSGTRDCNDLKKKFGGQKFYCGKMSSNAPANDYGRKPGTHGCITEDPSHD